jgi:hypothetical protein
MAALRAYAGGAAFILHEVFDRDTGRPVHQFSPPLGHPATAFPIRNPALADHRAGPLVDQHGQHGLVAGQIDRLGDTADLIVCHGFHVAKLPDIIFAGRLDRIGALCQLPDIIFLSRELD